MGVAMCPFLIWPSHFLDASYIPGDSSNVVCLFDFILFGFQFVGTTTTPFRFRFNIYKTCYRKSESSVPQMDFFRYFSEEGQHGFLWKMSVLRL